LSIGFLFGSGDPDENDDGSPLTVGHPLVYTAYSNNQLIS
jgi:hypothetical protein